MGIYDTVGYAEYENSAELIKILRDKKPHQLYKNATQPNLSAPVYLHETQFKTDFSSRITARVKKAKLTYRSFDSNETPRLSAHDAISQVAQSYGVIVSLLSDEERNSSVHNMRASFIAGLAYGMNKVRLVLQYGDFPVPVDYRDFVISCRKIEDINANVAEFATNVVEFMQEVTPKPKKSDFSFLEKVDFGSSAAENEMRTLQNYYLKTDAYLKASRGETQLVIGRKGSGKSAIFLQIRDKERSKGRNIVLDLQPDGYKLIKFKEQVLDFLEEGTFQHTIMAFWEYVLLLEICHKVLEIDKKKHVHASNLYEPYRKLYDLYKAEDYLTEGDFSERMSRLMDNLKANYQAKYQTQENVRLSTPEITGLLYQTDIKSLQASLIDYLKLKDAVWLLFDNVDKGWPASGLVHEDLIIIRTLIDAARKIQRYFDKNDIGVFPVIFLRNDVYELLVVESPDRQKEAKENLDWKDPDLLKQVIKLRITSSVDFEDENNFESIWRQLCVSHYLGEESFQFLVDRCLMRPRFLINLISQCRSFAINLGHTKIQSEDIEKGFASYSADLLTDIGFEIRDVFPQAEGILFRFITSKSEMSIYEVKSIIDNHLENKLMTERIIDLLLWYGFLGVKYDNHEPSYIYTMNYSLQLLKGLMQKKGDEVIFVINPGFWPALVIETV